MCLKLVPIMFMLSLARDHLIIHAFCFLVPSLLRSCIASASLHFSYLCREHLVDIFVLQSAASHTTGYDLSWRQCAQKQCIIRLDRHISTDLSRRSDHQMSLAASLNYADCAYDDYLCWQTLIPGFIRHRLIVCAVVFFLYLNHRSFNRNHVRFLA
jgi:hypothetical protein